MHANETGERVYWTRRWLVVLDDRQHEYEYGEMNARYVLYTLFCLKVQAGISPEQVIAELLHR